MLFSPGWIEEKHFRAQRVHADCSVFDCKHENGNSLHSRLRVLTFAFKPQTPWLVKNKLHSALMDFSNNAEGRLGSKCSNEPSYTVLGH